MWRKDTKIFLYHTIFLQKVLEFSLKNANFAPNLVTISQNIV